MQWADTGGMDPSSSPAFTLNSTDWLKGLRGAALTYAAGLLIQVMVDLQAYLQSCVDGATTCQLHLGMYEFLFPGLIALTGFGLEMIRRWKTDYRNR